eukprot:TRINITY_DN176_c0_g1_i14.p1 TRINITY_DN176_c0_g1~~TRINITY_DN176_c0_g1_i14.p1  ORF type:complete len:207 (-),score=54.56 TRINITY_DN176_c0_g1_i14:243-770(-)
MEKNSSLLSLNLRGNRSSGDEVWIRIAEALETNISLKSLNLEECGIGSAAAIRIAEMLEKNSSLLSLDLGWNEYVGDEGWIRIAEALEINTSLKSLNLRDCGIRSAAAIKIGEMLEKNSSLLSLGLGHNWDIGGEEWIRIAEALEINTSLKSLNLEGCGIGSAAAIKIAEILEKN